MVLYHLPPYIIILEVMKMKSKKLALLLIIVLIVSLFIPISFFTLFITEKGDATYHLTYKEFHDKYEDGELRDGDVAYIEDTFSDIWYNNSTEYTYMTFCSFDEYRTAPWGYDAGYSLDITDEYRAGDDVLIKVELEQELNSQGVPNIRGHIASIEHVNYID